ncbi:MAG: hypothetical protein WBF38_04690 [Nitrosotalea sp.]
MEISDILYQAISDYQEKRILSAIAQGESSEAISTIFRHCMPNLDKVGGNKPETRSALAEGLTHYMLTVALIPSQRKTTLDTIDIDVAIPDTRTLFSSPEDAVIICFSKTDQTQTITEQVDKLKKIQPKSENIWIVADKPILSDAKVYSLDEDQFTFANIINDLISFSSNKKQSKLKIFRI